jgi:hypothetical protein
MMESESYRKLCLTQQSELRELMKDPNQYAEAMQLFFSQHAMLHSAIMAQTEPWSFEDEVLDGLTEAEMRRIPENHDHSIAWNIWHIARIEDVAMNLLVAGRSQVFIQGNWLEHLQIKARDTGNTMVPEGVEELSASIDIEKLRDYRVAVGRRTRSIVAKIPSEELKSKVEPSRLQRVLDEGAVVEAARDLIEYWGRRDIAGLLLMPATRHNLVHLNESLKIKRKR